MTKRTRRIRLDEPTPEHGPRRTRDDNTHDPQATNSEHGESDRLAHARGVASDRPWRDESILLKEPQRVGLPGRPNMTGRPPGRPNVVTNTLKRAIMLAAEDVGEDGNGKDGLQGYLRRLALHEPQAFTSLLRRILPVQVKAEVDTNSTLGQVLEAVRSRQAQLSLTNSKVINATPSWKR